MGALLEILLHLGGRRILLIAVRFQHSCYIWGYELDRSPPHFFWKSKWVGGLDMNLKKAREYFSLGLEILS